MARRPRVLMVIIIIAACTLSCPAHHAAAHEDGRTAVSPTRDLVFPPPWAGEWRITTTYRRGDTHEVIAVDDITDVIRAREPVGLSTLTRGGLLGCSGRITDDRLDVSCSTKLGDGACQVGGTFAMAAHRTHETLAGSGELIAGATTGCGALAGDRVRTTVDLIGFRLARDPGDPAVPMAPLLTRFVASAPLLVLAATSRQVRPAVKEDCKDDRWRSFVNPVFRNQGQCVKFVER